MVTIEISSKRKRKTFDSNTHTQTHTVEIQSRTSPSKGHKHKARVNPPHNWSGLWPGAFVYTLRQFNFSKAFNAKLKVLLSPSLSNRWSCINLNKGCALHTHYIRWKRFHLVQNAKTIIVLNNERQIFDCFTYFIFSSNWNNRF